jgi:hypothetical protein
MSGTSFKQHVLRASLQTYVWYRAILERIDDDDVDLLQLDVQE